ncbi:MAG: metallophosphoesterase [Bacteroidales bacterium]
MMRIKKFLPYLLALVLVITGYILTGLVFPKNLNRYPALVLIVLLELYLWMFVKKKIFVYHSGIRLILIILYWLPLVSLISSSILAVYFPANEWNPSLRIHLFGLIFVTYVAKLIPSLILLFYKILGGLKRFVFLISGRKEKNILADSSHISRARFIENVAYISGGIMLSGLLTGMFRWVHDFRIFNQNVFLKNLPHSFENFKIIQISDLHLGSWSSTDQLEEAVNMINEEDADLVVFTGDLVNYSTDEAFRFNETLRRISARHGVLATLGNHDYGDYTKWPSAAAKQKNMTDLYSFYDSIGWKLLRNEHITIDKNGEKIALIGVENWGKNPRFPQLGDIRKAEEGIENVTVKILLSHDPSHWKEVVLPNHPDIQLMLAGHTHGFQFGIEIPGIRWSPAQYLYQEWAGMYTEESGERMLYVNRGIGSIGYPGRIGIMPEITVLTLRNSI